MKSINILFTLLLTITFISCDDYLDVEPKGLAVPVSIKEFDLLLNGGTSILNTTSNANALFFTADDFESTEDDLGDLDNPNNVALKLYSWDTDLFEDEVGNGSWNLPYQNIYTYNVVINSTDEALTATNYIEEDRNIIKAEAKVGRAYEYWLLINTFAKQYSEATAASDPGVPLIKVANPTGAVSSRSTVKEVYDFIINDVEASIEYLPEVAKNRLRPSKGTGYAMLARFYLSMNNYEKALENASLALLEKGEIADYNINFPFGGAYETEQYILRVFDNSPGHKSGYLSPDLANSFHPEDLRFTELLGNCESVFTPGVGWEVICGDHYRNNSVIFYINHAVSVPEMYLIRAECNARSGNIADVVSDLNALRVKRFPTGTYTDLTLGDFSSNEEALNFALEERRRELFMTGMRLFDLKRLNLDPSTAKTVIHTVVGVDYVMPPGANNLVLPIPSQILSLSSGVAQNPRD
ncbi:RagB/SusD family nutrient uptake outer membrane protein [Algibacter miyuki]|uniref:RagB/SusD family nutrient uptake outer membrane protein n=1 Tax=Algibacter miyuki TaxID=1306933 RepID=A0ABV5H2Q0_9FLAO|nr:RagB/SusD family nutrient uptake outer membrane protein [Algibacter miyuki]MDN3663848.1 RagB/SusD family nutrient uptake outer membrane protein [Algibacter miyuki]